MNANHQIVREFLAALSKGELSATAPTTAAAAATGFTDLGGISEDGVTLALNDEGAERVRLSISDPICRNLVTAALNEARKQFVKDEAADEAELPAPPCLPFDMEFFATVMEDYFKVPLLIERLLDGQSPAQASGLD